MAFWDRFFKTKKVEPMQAKPKKQNLGASWDSPYGSRPVFPPKEALEAYGEHAYLYAAITRTSEDLAAVPLKLIQGKGEKAKIISNHPVLDLLEDPNTMMDGFLFRQTLCMDLILNGTFWVLSIGSGKLPSSLVRLHPEETTFITDHIVGIKGVKNTSYGQSVIYPADRVFFGRNASYAKGPKSLYGTGCVEPLYQELQSDANALSLASQASKQGRPDVLISPSDSADVWGKEVREEIVNSYSRMAQKGGAIALSGMAKIDMLNLTPRDLEYATARTMAREAISAAIGVPPTILGIPDSNYATSLNQRKGYWTNQKNRARRLEVVYTKIAKLWNKDYRVVHDFSEIDALSTKKEALENIEKHIRFGMSPIKAYAYEGLEDAPIDPDLVLDVEEDEIEIDDDEKILELFISKSIEDKTMDRSARWNKWIAEKQAPAESKLIRASSSFLRDIKKKVLNRYKDSDFLQNVEDLVSRKEMQQMVDLKMKRIYREIYEQNLNSEYSRLKQSVNRSYVHKQIELEDKPPEESNFAKWLAFYLLMRSRIITTTIKKINALIDKLDPREEPKDVAAKLAASSAFALSRADTIGRTESTILVNNSTVEAAEVAVTTEPQAEAWKEWLTENDAEVRPEHAELDGQVKNVNSPFVVKSTGNETQYPGGFGVASLDVNCRCATLVSIENRPINDD